MVQAERCNSVKKRAAQPILLTTTLAGIRALRKNTLDAGRLRRHFQWLRIRHAYFADQLERLVCAARHECALKTMHGPSLDAPFACNRWRYQ
jgi:hypothetical protein